MNSNYEELHAHLQEQLGKLGRELPGPMTGFGKLHAASVEAGALDTKTKELIAIAISAAIRCEGCISYHVHDALAAGATRQEITEALGVAILMGGAPAAVNAVYVLDAVEQFSK